MAKEDTNQNCQLISCKQLSKRLSLSCRQIHRLNSCHKLPAPIRIGGSMRWMESTILEWLNSGAKDRKTFEAMQQVRGEL